MWNKAQTTHSLNSGEHLTPGLDLRRPLPPKDMKDDYLFECEVGGQVQKTKVTIFQSVGDPQVYGEIYTAKDPKLEDGGSNLHLIHPP